MRTVRFRRTRAGLKWLGTLAVVSIFVLWVVSRWVRPAVIIRHGSRSEYIVATQGLVWLYRYDFSDVHAWRRLQVATDYESNRALGVPATWYWWFRFGNDPKVRASPYAFPLWLPLLLIGVPTVRLWIRAYRADPNACPNCGYDRVGLAADACCPECGSTSPTPPNPSPPLVP